MSCTQSHPAIFMARMLKPPLKLQEDDWTDVLMGDLLLDVTTDDNDIGPSLSSSDLVEMEPSAVNRGVLTARGAK